jgi:hypothetical protein
MPKRRVPNLRGLLTQPMRDNPSQTSREGLLGLLSAAANVSDVAEIANFGMRMQEPQFRQQLTQRPPGLQPGGQIPVGLLAQSSPQELRGLLGQPVLNQAQSHLMSALLPAMTAYHGSPHKFDKFDSSKIGTGEGAQAYGHGLYFAENPDVAKSYRFAGNPTQSIDVLVDGASARSKLSQESYFELMDHNGDFDAAIDTAAELGDTAIASELSSLRSAAKSIEVSSASSGSFVEVDIPDDAIDRMLDWDKPLSEQPESIRTAVHRAFADAADDAADPSALVQGSVTNSNWESEFISGKSIDDLDGASIQELLQKVYGGEGTSAKLNELGIPGIRYLDGNSRGSGEGTRNFVVFDDTLPKIIKRE